MNYSDRDNGTLSSNTQHCTPLECGDWAHHDSIDIAGISIALLIQSLDPLE